MNRVNRLRETLAGAATFLRWRDWGPSKIPVFCTLLAYIGLTSRNLSFGFVVHFIFYLIFASLHSALGYVANNFSDQKIDKAQGKSNPFLGLTRARAIGFMLGLLGAALLSGLPFVRQSGFWWLWAVWAFFALSYSLKPVRLKERGKWGLAVSALAQWTLPVILTFTAMGRTRGWDMWVFVLGNTVSGATLEIAHQRWDRWRDQQTGTKTFGTRTDSRRLDRLYRVALVLDKTAIGAIIVTVCVAIRDLFPGISPAVPGLPLLLAYALLLTLSIREVSRARRNGIDLDPYYQPIRNANKVLHETIPNLIVPTYLMMLVVIVQPINGVLLAAFLYWRIVLGQADWRWPIRFLLSQFSR